MQQVAELSITNGVPSVSNETGESVEDVVSATAAGAHPLVSTSSSSTQPRWLKVSMQRVVRKQHNQEYPFSITRAAMAVNGSWLSLE